MAQMFETLGVYFQYPFVMNAFVAGVLIALCSSLFGVTLVLKRLSFIGDGLSHVAFGATAVATAASFSNSMPLVLLVTAGCAVWLLRAGEKAKTQGDAALAMLSVGSLATGYLLLNIFPPSSGNVSGDVCSALFGSTSILTLSQSEVTMCVVLAVVVVAVFVLLYNKIFAVTFDEGFARATGVRAGRYNMIIAVITAVIIVLAMNLVGSLLVSALVVFPALCAMRLFQNFKAVTVCAAALSVLCTALGILTSILAGTPVGATIVAIDMLAYGLCTLAGGLAKGAKACV